MNMINGYQAYRNDFYDNSVANRNAQNATSQKTSQTESVGKAEQTAKTEAKPKLSEAAQDLLKELREKYSNMDIMTADYSTQEEAQSYLSRGTKEYSVLIHTDELERLAASADGKETLMAQIDSSVEQLQSMKEQLGEDGEDVKTLGVSIGRDGTVSYFAELEKAGEAQRQRIEKAREDRRAERKEDEKKAQEKRDRDKKTEKSETEKTGKRKEEEPESVKRTTVRADSVEELLRQIREVDWDSIKAADQIAGSRIDFAV